MRERTALLVPSQDVDKAQYNAHTPLAWCHAGANHPWRCHVGPSGYTQLWQSTAVHRYHRHQGPRSTGRRLDPARALPTGCCPTGRTTRPSSSRPFHVLCAVPRRPAGHHAPCPYKLSLPRLPFTHLAATPPAPQYPTHNPNNATPRIPASSSAGAGPPCRAAQLLHRLHHRRCLGV